MGDRKTEAYTDKKVGITSYYLGDYLKAKEYLHKALAIRIQIGDKKGEASSTMKNFKAIKISIYTHWFWRADQYGTKLNTRQQQDLFH